MKPHKSLWIVCNGTYVQQAYLCVYIMYVCMYVCMSVCARGRVCVCACLRVHVCVCACVCAHVRMCAFVHVYMCVCMCVYVFVYRSSQRSWQLSLNRMPVGEPWIIKYVCIFLV